MHDEELKVCDMLSLIHGIDNRINELNYKNSEYKATMISIADVLSKALKSFDSKLVAKYDSFSNSISISTRVNESFNILEDVIVITISGLLECDGYPYENMSGLIELINKTVSV